MSKTLSENNWTESICRKLEPFLERTKLQAKCFQKLPYSQEVISYSDAWEPEYEKPSRFETDLIIFEKQDEKIIPRVVIESKFGKITTHDAITYSRKAEIHKNITPHLRYGIMIGNYEALPGRLFRHGTNFDFMFCFKGNEPTDSEWEVFTEMIEKEVNFSKSIQNLLHETRGKNRERYYMLQKEICLK